MEDSKADFELEFASDGEQEYENDPFRTDNIQLPPPTRSLEAVARPRAPPSTVSRPPRKKDGRLPPPPVAPPRNRQNLNGNKVPVCC